MKEIDMETAAEIMNAKIKVEMKARQRIEKKERRWEVRQQEEKIVYDPYSNILNFEKRRVTDMATCRRVYPPPPLPSDKTIVSKNMTDTRECIKTVCDRKGILKAQNILEEVGLQSLERRVSRGEVVIMPTDKSKKIQSTMSSKEKKCEESRGKRISVKVRVVEKGGTSLKQKLVRRDISFRQN